MKAKVLYVMLIVLAVLSANPVVARSASGFYTTPYAVVNAVIDDGDQVWIGTDRGISKIHTGTGEINSFIDTAAGLGDVAITALALDAQGRLLVGTYDNGVTWNAEGFASGMYFYRLNLGGSKVLTRKMLLLR